MRRREKPLVASVPLPLHASHPALIAGLKRADGHLRALIGIIEAGKPCVEIARRMQAVEKAVTNVKRALIHDHRNHVAPAFLGLALLATSGMLMALKLWPANDPMELEHNHSNLPLDHPHLNGERHHAHPFVVDDHHPRRASLLWSLEWRPSSLV